MSLGATVYALRKAHGISLLQLEKKTGINKNVLSDFEHDVEALGQAKLEKLSESLGVTTSVLFAVARSVSKRPDILLEGNNLTHLVDKLSVLIDQYLQTSDTIRKKVDKILI